MHSTGPTYILTFRLATLDVTWHALRVALCYRWIVCRISRMSHSWEEHGYAPRRRSIPAASSMLSVFLFALADESAPLDSRRRLALLVPRHRDALRSLAVSPIRR